MELEKKSYPGDADYKGGVFHTIVYIDGKRKDVRTEKDGDGNVISVSITDKI